MFVRPAVLALLEGPSLFVHLDPRRTGVVVPKWFLGQPQLVLQVGLNMPIPIPDLRVDDDGLSCTLSFSRSPFWCNVQWSAIYALVGEDGRGRRASRAGARELCGARLGLWASVVGVPLPTCNRERPPEVSCA